MNDQIDTEEVTCSHCSGSGEGMADGSSCWVCKGRGTIQFLTDSEQDDDGDAKYDQWNEEERG